LLIDSSKLQKLLINQQFFQFSDRIKSVAFVETNILNADMCKLESSKSKTEPSCLIPRKLAANLQLLIIIKGNRLL